MNVLCWRKGFNKNHSLSVYVCLLCNKDMHSIRMGQNLHTYFSNSTHAFVHKSIFGYVP